MQLATFKIFCDLVESESFSKAAKENGITQSAVSQQIRALESRFNVALVERGRRHFSLTPEGHAFLESSRQILDIYNNLDARIQEMRDVVVGELRVAAVFSIGLHQLPPMLKRYRTLFPEVDVEVDYRRSTQIYAEVQTGNADVGLVAYPSRRKGFDVETFARDEMVLICPPSHRLARKKKVKFADLNDERFISFEIDLPTRKAIDKALSEERVSIQRSMEFDNIETVKRAVAIEDGVSIVPYSSILDEQKAGTLVAISLASHDLWRPLGLVVRRNRTRTPAVRRFIEMLHAMGESRPQPGDSE